MAGGDDIRAAADKTEAEAADLLSGAREEEYEAKRAYDAHMAAAFEKSRAATMLRRESYGLRNEARSIDLAEARAERATEELRD